jgi:SHS2 domain-containing protein
MPWAEIEDHTADVGIEAWSNDFEGLLIECCSAFSELTSPDYEDVGSSISHEIVVEGKEPDSVLQELLSEMLVLFDTKHFLANTWGRLQVIDTSDGLVVSVAARGGTFVQGQHTPGAQIKAVTWYQLTCDVLEDGTWYALVIFDV